MIESEEQSRRRAVEAEEAAAKADAARDEAEARASRLEEELDDVTRARDRSDAESTATRRELEEQLSAAREGLAAAAMSRQMVGLRKRRLIARHCTTERV